MEEGPSNEAANGQSDELHWRFSQVKGIIENEEQPTDGLILFGLTTNNFTVFS
jgi:hypothetical protein